jgi:methane/ammonia monooxygenase subunit C
MSSVIQTPVQTSARADSRAKERSVFNPRLALGTMVGITLLMAAYRIYQQIFAWSAGLDSTDPAFETYWMNLLKGELVLLVCSWVGLWSWLWVTRDRNLAALKPRDEIRRYFNLVLYILVYAFCVYFTGSFFAEMDASWHQTVVRDTAFTPSHVILFYGTIPLYILFGVGAFLYSVTRLPRFAERLSIPFTLAVAGPFLILPNLGYNEWGHAFWMMEDRPTHVRDDGAVGAGGRLSGR